MPREGCALTRVFPRAYLADVAFWKRLFGRTRGEELKPQRLDYLNEALALERQGDYEAALTSYRLALRDTPTDLRVLQNMAIAYTKTNHLDEAIRFYRKALDIDASLAGAHYGIAFLLIKRGEIDTAVRHLRTFLGRPPRGPDAAKWIEHAQQTLAQLDTAGSQG